MTTATTRQTDEMLADMNGPLAYWGPTIHTTPVRGSRASAGYTHDVECLVLERLAETVNDRTWTGTAMLMGEAFRQADLGYQAFGRAAA
jgi:hypothetical protein